MQMDTKFVLNTAESAAAAVSNPPEFSEVADGFSFTSHPLLSQVLVGEELIISAVDLFLWPSVVGQQCFARMTL